MREILYNRPLLAFPHMHAKVSWRSHLWYRIAMFSRHKPYFFYNYIVMYDLLGPCRQVLSHPSTRLKEDFLFFPFYSPEKWHTASTTFFNVLMGWGGGVGKDGAGREGGDEDEGNERGGLGIFLLHVTWSLTLAFLIIICIYVDTGFVNFFFSSCKESSRFGGLVILNCSPWSFHQNQNIPLSLFYVTILSYTTENIKYVLCND